MSQVAGIKDALAVQETELTSAGATRNMAEHGRRHLKAECQRLRSDYSDGSPSIPHRVSVFSLCLVVNQLFFLGLRMRALLDIEEKAAVN